MRVENIQVALNKKKAFHFRDTSRPGDRNEVPKLDPSVRGNEMQLCQLHYVLREPMEYQGLLYLAKFP